MPRPNRYWPKTYGQYVAYRAARTLARVLIFGTLAFLFALAVLALVR